MGVFGLGCLLMGGLTAVRLLYEGLFPLALWLGNPVVAVIVAASMTLLAAVVGGRVLRLSATLAFTPLLLNVVYLFEPVVGLMDGRFLFLASIWLTLLFLAHQQGILKRRRWLPLGFVISFLLPVYLLTLGQTVGTADTFEFQVVIPKLGIVHPTGYPLYLLLTKLFTFIRIQTAAWRINFGTGVYGLGAACLLYLFLKSLTKQRLVSILAAVLFGLTPTFWSQSVQAEVYSLQALILAGALWRMGRGGRGSGLEAAFLLGLGLRVSTSSPASSRARLPASSAAASGTSSSRPGAATARMSLGLPGRSTTTLRSPPFLAATRTVEPALPGDSVTATPSSLATASCTRVGSRS
jgi:hypothetical protein